MLCGAHTVNSIRIHSSYFLETILCVMGFNKKLWIHYNNLEVKSNYRLRSQQES